MSAPDYDWVNDGARGEAEHYALRTGDYDDPWPEPPTLAECDRDEYEAGGRHARTR